MWNVCLLFTLTQFLSFSWDRRKDVTWMSWGFWSFHAGPCWQYNHWGQQTASQTEVSVPIRYSWREASERGIFIMSLGEECIILDRGFYVSTQNLVQKLSLFGQGDFLFGGHWMMTEWKSEENTITVLVVSEHLSSGFIHLIFVALWKQCGKWHSWSWIIERKLDSCD